MRKRISKELNAITQQYVIDPQIGEDENHIWVGSVKLPFVVFEFNRGFYLPQKPKKFFIQGFWRNKHFDGVFLAEQEATIEEYLAGLKITNYIIFCEEK